MEQVGEQELSIMPVLFEVAQPADKWGRRPPRIKCPPEHWIERIRKEGLSDEQIVHRWVIVMSKHQRRSLFRVNYHHQRTTAKTMSNALARVAEGTSDVRTLNYVNRGGYSKHETLQAAKDAEAASRRESRHRISSDLLGFRKLHTRGCSVTGCILRPDAQEVVHFLLFEFDHRDDEEKRDYVTCFSGETRLQELAKTDCKCLWCHFKHTRQQSGFRPTSNRGEQTMALVELARYKERTGCEHPCHHNMSYATLVPGADVDPLMYGFLEVSHFNRGNEDIRGTGLEDVQRGLAEIHCKFCHRLFTLCEDAQMYDTEFTQHQYAQLLKYNPAFVQYFIEKTIGFDWKAEVKRINSLRSAGHQDKRARNENASDLCLTEESSDA